MVALVDYYQYYVPVANPISAFVQSNAAAISQQSVNNYTETYSGETSITLPFTPYSTDFVDVFVNNTNIVNKVVDAVEGGYTYTRFSVTGDVLTWIDGPTVGDSIKVVNYFGISESKFYRIDLTSVLVQGITDSDTNGAFIGSVECYPVIVHQPLNGFVRIAWDRMGFEYSMNSSALGPDSFAYKLVSRYGQESDPACVYINANIPSSTT